MELHTLPTHALRIRPGKPHHERGQSLVELAFALPIFLILVFAIIDFSLGLRAWISITNAAREGARIGAIHSTCEEIEDRVVETSGGLIAAGDADDLITIDPDDCDWEPGSSVIVTVEYEYELITPLGGMLSVFGDGLGLPSSINIQSTSDMRVE